MKITDEDNTENCFDSDFVVKYKFDSPWTDESIRALGALGRLDYYTSFPKPMFRLTCDNGVFVTGVCGDAECRVIYGRNRTDDERAFFADNLQKLINPF